MLYTLLRFRRTLSPVWLLGWWLALALPLQADGPTLKRLFPAGAQRGQTVDVTAAGDAPKWPVTAWCDNPGVRFEAQKDKGKFSVTVDANARLGLCFVRFYDEDNSTDLLRFIVGSVPEQNEAEPDDAIAKLTPVGSLPRLINGVLEKRGDVDSFTVDLNEGQWLTASIQANHGLRSPMDATLQVLSPTGIVLAQNLDTQALDPRVSFFASRSGRYFVRVFAFPETPDSSINYAGGEAYVYRLTLASNAWVHGCLPLGINLTGTTQLKLLGNGLSRSELDVTLSTEDQAVFAKRPWLLTAPDVQSALELDVTELKLDVEQPREKDAPPQKLEVPGSVTGVLSKQQERDRYRIAGEREKKLRISVHSRRLGMPMDPYLRIYDDQGKQVMREDDTAKQIDSRPIFSPTLTGSYDIEITDAFGGGGDDWLYRLDVEPVEPDVVLTVKADHFKAKLDEALEIPVSIERRDGYDKKLKISVEGLPDSVQCDVVESTKDGPSAKEVKLSLKAKEAFSGSFKIVASLEGDDEPSRTISLAGEPSIESLWLIAR